MSEPQTFTSATEDELQAAFDKLLDSTSTNDGELVAPEPTPEPEAEPAPESEEKPGPVAAKGEAPKVDKRTREGKRQSIQQEIDAETARRYTAKQEADAEEARLASLRAERTRLETQPAPTPKLEAPYIAPPPQVQAEYKRLMALPDAPKIEEFTGETGYIDWQFAVSDFVAEKRYEARQQQAQIAQHHEKNQARFDKEVIADPTFRERFEKTPVDTRMVPYLQQHEYGAEIMVYLVNHPETAQRLATLKSQTAQAETIGEIVGALRASAAAVSGPASKPSPISRAKPVIKPVTSSPDVGSDDDDGDGDDDSVSVEEHIRRENRRDSARYR